jgi:hypothetical protein
MATCYDTINTLISIIRTLVKYADNPISTAILSIIMKNELVISKEEAMGLLEADLITIRFFIDICHRKGWKLDDTLLKNEITTQDIPDEKVDLLKSSPIRLVYSRD